MEWVKIIVEKLSQYNFLTNILPGTVLCIILRYAVGYNLFVTEDWYTMGIILYFAGMVNNRFGSICIEPLLKKMKIIDFAPYTNFIKAEQIDSKLSTLSMENNIFRSYISVFILSLFAYMFKSLTNWVPCIGNIQIIIVFILLLMLFILSYRKQTSYIKNRVEVLLKEE